MDKITVFHSMVLDEYDRSHRMLEAYIKEKETLPKGSLIVKKRKNNVYYYLEYRENKTPVSKYIGNKNADISELQRQINRRKVIEEYIKSLKKEIQEMEYMLKYKEWKERKYDR